MFTLNQIQLVKTDNKLIILKKITMKKIINTLLLTFGLGLFGMLINSCNNDDCEGLPSSRTFIVDSFTPSLATRSENEIVEITPEESELIPYDSLIFRLSPNSSLAQTNNKNIINFKLSQSLYACIPALDNYGFIDSIQVTSNKDYTSSFPAGSDLSEIMVNYLYESSEPLNNYVSNYYSGNDLIIGFTEEPAIEELRNLTFTFFFNDRPTITTVFTEVLIGKTL